MLCNLSSHSVSSLVSSYFHEDKFKSHADDAKSVVSLFLLDLWQVPQFSLLLWNQQAFFPSEPFVCAYRFFFLYVCYWWRCIGCFPLLTSLCDVVVTLLRRCCDVSLWRCCNVVLTSLWRRCNIIVTTLRRCCDVSLWRRCSVIVTTLWRLLVFLFIFLNKKKQKNKKLPQEFQQKWREGNS